MASSPVQLVRLSCRSHGGAEWHRGQWEGPPGVRVKAGRGGMRTGAFVNVGHTGYLYLVGSLYHPWHVLTFL